MIGLHRILTKLTLNGIKSATGWVPPPGASGPNVVAMMTSAGGHVGWPGRAALSNERPSLHGAEAAPFLCDVVLAFALACAEHTPLLAAAPLPCLSSRELD